MKCIDCKNENFGLCPKKDTGNTYPTPNRCDLGSTHKRKEVIKE